MSDEYQLARQQQKIQGSGSWRDRRRSIVQAPLNLIIAHENFFEEDSLLVSLGNSSITLEVVQNQMNTSNVTKLVISIIKSGPSHPVMMEAVKLSVAILNGGNREVQV